MSEPHRVVAQNAIFESLRDSYLKPVYGNRILGTDVDVTLVCADSVAGNHHSLDYRVRVTLEHGTVHKCAGVTLVGVTYDVLFVGNGIVRELPFVAGGESSAAAPSQSALLNDVDYLLRSHFGDNLLISEIAVVGKVFVDVLRIDYAAVTEHKTMLALIERGFVERLNRAVLVSFLVEQSFDNSSLEDMFEYDFLDVGDLDVLIECAVGINHDDRSARAKSEAARHDELDFFIELVFL